MTTKKNFEKFSHIFFLLFIDKRASSGFYFWKLTYTSSNQAKKLSKNGPIDFPKVCLKFKAGVNIYLKIVHLDIT